MVAHAIDRCGDAAPVQEDLSHLSGRYGRLNFASSFETSSAVTLPARSLPRSRACSIWEASTFNRASILDAGKLTSIDVPHLVQSLIGLFGEQIDDCLGLCHGGGWALQFQGSRSPANLPGLHRVEALRRSPRAPRRRACRSGVRSFGPTCPSRGRVEHGDALGVVDSNAETSAPTLGRPFRNRSARLTSESADRRSLPGSHPPIVISVPARPPTGNVGARRARLPHTHPRAIVMVVAPGRGGRRVRLLSGSS